MRNETIAEWLVKMIFMVIIMAGFAWCGAWLAASHGVGYVIGIATAIIITEMHRLAGTFKIDSEESEEDKDENN